MRWERRKIDKSSSNLSAKANSAISLGDFLTDRALCAIWTSFPLIE
ncbi:hypothetical protein BIW11_03007 [Tropilaelaps mercedesae]|uniref:Uncharacterized protein n=1 Tax=Tropilaelaps mercedesae TaxID=418985 RepID=A0A1V9XTE9_9ACAR|nr:hypothetical protein BIW11_03007 [Tropilaelaps mercedesae]